jgi:hypothetical protein
MNNTGVRYSDVMDVMRCRDILDVIVCMYVKKGTFPNLIIDSLSSPSTMYCISLKELEELKTFKEAMEKGIVVMKRKEYYTHELESFLEAKEKGMVIIDGKEYLAEELKIFKETKEKGVRNIILKSWRVF